MGISDEIHSDYERNHTWSFSDEQIRSLLTEDDVIRRLEHGEHPIDLSIEKWMKIHALFRLLSNENGAYRYYRSFLDFIGYRSCALCVTSIRTYELSHGSIQYRGDKCTVCPLAAIDRCIDADSTYDIIDTLLNAVPSDMMYFSMDQKLNQNIQIDAMMQRMIDNLKELSPEPLFQ